MKPNFLVVGFPKSGTTTLQTAFVKSGIVSAHWKIGPKIVGKLVYDGWYKHQDPFHFFEGVEAITQMDFCNLTKNGQLLSLWPNLDINLLLQIRKMYPDCKFIFNYRDPVKTADSISRWHDFQDRITRSDCPNLPKGYGSQEEICEWIKAHQHALRTVFKDDPNFMEYDISADTAQQDVETFIGRKLAWWGIANANRSAPKEKAVT